MHSPSTTSHLHALCACLTLALPGLSFTQDSSTPSVPVGTLSASPTAVQTGTFPTLNWDISYPEKVTDVIDIEPPGVITPKKDLYMDVRVVGASFQTSPGNWKPVQAWLRADGSSSWTSFFYDTQPNVDPTRIYYTKLVHKNRANHFGGRYYSNGWSSFRSTTSSNSYYVTALVNGDEPPSYAPAFNQGDIESFLNPYMDDDGNVSIGPMDVIYLFELYSTSPGGSYFDMQDLVLLVTFREVESDT